MLDGGPRVGGIGGKVGSLEGGRRGGEVNGLGVVTENKNRRLLLAFYFQKIVFSCIIYF